ncbi:MAG: adenylate/guanylate cyclase domain-containing protein [Planctomycetales bacterium]
MEGVSANYWGTPRRDSGAGRWSRERPDQCLPGGAGDLPGIHGEVGAVGHPLQDFRVGIGLAQGKAVAGKIGTQDHVKVTVFGPVVNLASRLEGMTKQLRVPILIDETMARVVRERMSPDQARCASWPRFSPPDFRTRRSSANCSLRRGNYAH